MRNPLHALVLLALCSPVMAQGFTTPPGYLSKEGMMWQDLFSANGWSHILGAYADLRYQQVDAEVRAKGASVLKSVGFRVDYQSQNASARSWNNVTLRLCDGDYAKVATAFSLNQLSTPTLVFSGSVAWPQLSGVPGSKPAPWAAAYRFPFGAGGGSSTYAYSAAKDLCMDFLFSGGKLANGGTWSGRTAKPYYVDGIRTYTNQVFGGTTYRYIGSSQADCRDSSQTRGFAYAGGRIQLWGYSSNPAWSGKAVMTLFGGGMARNSFSLHAIGLGGGTPGGQFGPFGCYNLMFDASKQLAVFNLPTNGNGEPRSLNLPVGDLKVLAPLGVFQAWTQAVWTDSQTNKPKLSAATRFGADFGTKLNTSVPRKRTLYHYIASSQWGFGGVRGDYPFLPIVRFE